MTISLKLLCLISLVPATATAAVNYPVIGQELRNQITEVRATGAFLGSEYTEIWQDEYVAIYLPSHPQKGMLFKVNFVPTGVEDYLEPVLTEYRGSTSVTITSPRDYLKFKDGTKEIFGSTEFLGQTIYFYIWSWFEEEGDGDGDGPEKWSVNLTWGDSAALFNVGTEVDRTTFGVLEDEPRKCGFKILGTSFADGQFCIDATHDSDAEVNMEVSTNLKTWEPITAERETIPSTFKYEEGVRFIDIHLSPNLTPELKAKSADGIYFRIK